MQDPRTCDPKDPRTGTPKPTRTMTRNRFRHWPTGFTLIELLIVVAIIAILAAIAVPNFLEAQTRAKVSRAQSDMRTIAVALESYAVDGNAKYPFRNRKPGASGVFRVGDALRIAEDLDILTTPVAYITSLPADVFKSPTTAPNHILDYWDTSICQEVRQVRISDPFNTRARAATWTLFSLGPDREFGQIQDISNYPLSASGSFTLDYDPTNGTVSQGNVFRFRTQDTAQVYFNSR